MTESPTKSIHHQVAGLSATFWFPSTWHVQCDLCSITTPIPVSAQDRWPRSATCFLVFWEFGLVAWHRFQHLVGIHGSGCWDLVSLRFQCLGCSMLKGRVSVGMLRQNNHVHPLPPNGVHQKLPFKGHLNPLYPIHPEPCKV